LVASLLTLEHPLLTLEHPGRWLIYRKLGQPFPTTLIHSQNPRG